MLSAFFNLMSNGLEVMVMKTVLLGGYGYVKNLTL